MCFSFSGWWLFRLILFLLVLLVLLAEASNGHQPRYKYKCFKSSSRVIVLWVYLWTMLYTSETWFIVYNCNKMEFAACSLYGIWLCRHNGKSMRVKKNHSGANLTHNHKLFYGDMLSFIQVATPMITPSHHFLFKHFSLLVFNLFYFIYFTFTATFIYRLWICLIQASGQQIPIVVQSCICFINLNGKCSRLKAH